MSGECPDAFGDCSHISSTAVWDPKVCECSDSLLCMIYPLNFLCLNLNFFKFVVCMCVVFVCGCGGVE